MSKTKTETVAGKGLYYGYYASPVGRLLLAGDAHGLQSIQFETKHSIESDWQENREFFAPIMRQLDEYFAQTRKVFQVKLNPIGTAFQQSVWQKLQTIPYAQSQCYADIAIAIDNPKAARAIGMANHKNPIPIIIPCHRVIGKNGHLTGYAGGLQVKQYLLDLER